MNRRPIRWATPSWLIVWTSVFILFQVMLDNLGSDAWKGLCFLVGFFAVMRIAYCALAWADEHDEARR